MSGILLGTNRDSAQEFHLPLESFRTHWHLIGATGKGKTTAIETILHQLLGDRFNNQACFFLIDRMGSFSFSLLRWMASKFCPERVRKRLVYIEPSREDVVIPFNPLLYDTLAHGYFKVTRAVDIILRAWESQNVQEMPRLARWTFNAIWACALQGLTILDTAHLLMPGSPYHDAFLRRLPPVLKAEWEEIQRARGGEASRILESSRNRLKPYFENPILSNMFGSTRNGFDVPSFMRNGKIVLLNLAPQNRLSSQIADAIGGLALNEILATARSMPLGTHVPTYVFLDEFQRFVSGDIEEAIPEVRQLGVRLLLSHQSFSQLVRGDTDLTSLIWQAQSRMMFGVQGEDADILAHEIGSLLYDARKIKDEIFSRRQLQKGHRIVELCSWSESNGAADQWALNYGRGWGEQEGVARGTEGRGSVRSEGDSISRQEGRTRGGSATQSRTSGGSQHLVPEHEEFMELSSRTYSSFEEQKMEWAREMRKLKTGQALVRLVDDPTIYPIAVHRDTPGLLDWDVATLKRRAPQVLEAVYKLIEENFQSEYFVRPEAIERESKERLERLLHPVTEVRSPSSALQPAPVRRTVMDAPAGKKSPFQEEESP